jgi:hypothetical protein
MALAAQAPAPMAPGMTTWNGPAGKGAMRAHRERKQVEAAARQEAADGALDALRQKTGQEADGSVPEPGHTHTTLCCLKKGSIRDKYDHPPDLPEVPFAHLNVRGRKVLAKIRAAMDGKES